MNLECRILPTSTRNLRQTKAEMRRELEELRWNMRQGVGDPHSTPGSLGDASSFRSPHDQMNGSFSNPSAPRTEASMSPGMDLGIPGSVGNDAKPNANGPTLPRALDGFVVDARKIDDCFALYDAPPSLRPGLLIERKVLHTIPPTPSNFGITAKSDQCERLLRTFSLPFLVYSCHGITALSRGSHHS